LQKKYGNFSPTDNRKHMVSTLLGKYPDLGPELSKQLKHSMRIEKVMYDLSTSAGVSVSLLEKRKSLTTDTETPAETQVIATPAVNQPQEEPEPHQDPANENFGIEIQDETQVMQTSDVNQPPVDIEPQQDPANENLVREPGPSNAIERDECDTSTNPTNVQDKRTADWIKDINIADCLPVDDLKL
jgi:hypothetical protein